MRISSSLATLLAVAGFSSAEPNGWSKTKSAPDSPTKLDDCGCWPIYQAILRCQKLKVNDNTRDCVCIENPDGWYPSMDGCRNCLSPGSLEDDFFDNVSRLVTQLFVSCTNAGGGVRSDGKSLCASNYYREACVSLGTNGKPSWASYEVFEDETKGNSSYVLDIKQHGSDKDEESTSLKSTASKTAAATTATDASADTSSAATTASNADGPSSASDNASGTETSAALATTTPSSAATVGGSNKVTGLKGVFLAAIAGVMAF